MPGTYKKRLLKELLENGYSYKDLDDIFQQKSLQEKEVEIILKWLPLMYTEHYGAADILVRALISSSEPFPPDVLISLFESDLNFSLKSGIANALAYAKTGDISGWIKGQLLNDYSTERSLLIDGLKTKGRFADNRELISFLKGIFDKYHDDAVLKLFKKYGNAEDIPFLKEKAELSEKKLAKAINKTIEGIKK